MTEMIKNIYATMVSIYHSIETAAGFVGSVTQWLGFSTILVLIGILFFFKIFNAIYPKTRLINWLLALIAFSLTWGAWNLSYYKDLRFFDMLRIYGFISLHLLALLFIHFILNKTIEYLKKRFRYSKLSKNDTLELYDLIDTGALKMKESLRNGNFKKVEIIPVCTIITLSNKQIFEKIWLFHVS